LYKVPKGKQMKLSDAKVGMVICWGNPDATYAYHYRVLAIRPSTRPNIGQFDLEVVRPGGGTFKNGHIVNDWLGSLNVDVTVVSQPKKTARKFDYYNNRKDLYLVTTKGGVTHKGIASVVNRRKLDTFGNSPTHALSVWEDKHGKKLDINKAVVWKMVPFQVRKQANGRYRVGREIK
jgi:hypothetical protein